MARGLWVACVLVLGCKGLDNGRQGYSPPPDVIPPPSNGIVIDDRRPDWEKRPFTGPVSLYHLGKVKPNPWEQLAKETEAVVAAMPQKPESVIVTVTAFRLVKKDEVAAPSPDPVQMKVGDRNSSQLNQPATVDALNYQAAVNAQRAGDQQTVQRALGAMTGQGANPAGPNAVAPPVGIQVGTPNPNDGENDFFLHYPAGACCEVHAVIKLTFSSGQMQELYVKGIGTSPNTTGSPYWGEALAAAVRVAVAQYGQQFRQGIGMNLGAPR